MRSLMWKIGTISEIWEKNPMQLSGIETFKYVLWYTDYCYSKQDKAGNINRGQETPEKCNRLSS